MEGATAVSAPTADAGSAPVATAPVIDSAPVATPTAEPVSSGISQSVLDSAPADLLSGDPASIADPVATVPNSGIPIETSDANMNWMEKNNISQELRDNPNISKYKTLDDALNANANLVKKLGEKGIMRPDENASQEAKDAWFDHIGRPDNANGYTDFVPPMIMDGEGNETSAYEIDQEFYSEAKDFFYSIGATDEQQQALMDYHSKLELKRADADLAYTNEQATQTRATLEKEWGAKMGAKVTSAINIADKLGIKETLISKGLGNDLSIIKMLDSMGEMIGESRLTGDVSSSGGGFEAQLASVMASPAYSDKSHPDYHKMQKLRLDLYAKKYPNQ